MSNGCSGHDTEDDDYAFEYCDAMDEYRVILAILCQLPLPRGAFCADKPLTRASDGMAASSSASSNPPSTTP